MSWEESKALTPLKRDFLLGVSPRRREFFLTGGSALGIFYLDHRLSYDLDLDDFRAYLDRLRVTLAEQSFPG